MGLKTQKAEAADNDDGVRSLWRAVVAQIVADAAAPDAALFAGRGESTSSSRPTLHDRAKARTILTCPSHGGWRRELADLAGLPPDALDRTGRRLAADGWRMDPAPRVQVAGPTAPGRPPGLASRGHAREARAA